MKLIIPIIIAVLLLLLMACDESNLVQSEPTEIHITNYHIEVPESQAITNSGIPVIAPDINFGKIYFTWSTNWQSQQYYYYLHLSTDLMLTEIDLLVGNSQCNTQLVSCWPEKQRHCVVSTSLRFECLFNSGKSIYLLDYFDISTEEVLYLILTVCPSSNPHSPACNSMAQPFKIELECSEYSISNCWDQEPLEISDFKILGTELTTNDVAVFNAENHSTQKFSPTWNSTWRVTEYPFQLLLIDPTFPEQEQLLLSSHCNQNISCYPIHQRLCNLTTNEKITIECIGSSNTIQIENVFLDNVKDLSLILRIQDEIFQQEIELMTPIQIRRF